MADAIHVRKIEPGVGRIVLHSHGSAAVFSELSSTYPLKLLSPRIDRDCVAVVYNMSYGGGLVGGDHIQLSIDVGPGAVLVLLTQGSTKVFKTRLGHRASTPARLSNTHGQDITEQRMDAAIADGGALFLLPDPVTCFRSASYSQIQTLRLSGSASAVLLDWVTAGRKSLGEAWSFSRYYSANEVLINGKRIAKDVLLLDDQEIDPKPLPRRKLSERLAPYSCYATVIVYGALVQSIIHDLSLEYKEISVFKRNAPPALLWSLSPITAAPDLGCIVRVAGNETEDVKSWLANAFRKLETVVGTDVYRKAFG